MGRVQWVVALGAIGLLALAALVPPASARAFRGTLTEPSGGAPFGGDVVGEYRISVRGNQVGISAWVDLSPMGSYVFEGWLVDMQTGYKLSLGALSHGDDDDDDDEGRMVLEFHQRMVNVWTYGVLVITTEPSRDLDPNPATPAAGALLPAPFGQ